MQNKRHRSETPAVSSHKKRKLNDDDTDTGAWMRVAADIRKEAASRKLPFVALPQRKPRLNRRHRNTLEEAQDHDSSGAQEARHGGRGAEELRG